MHLLTLSGTALLNHPGHPRDQLIFASILRVFGAVVCLLLAVIAGFGFLHSFEVPGLTVWKLGYGSISVLFFAGFWWLLFQAIRGFQGVGP